MDILNALVAFLNFVFVPGLAYGALTFIDAKTDRYGVNGAHEAEKLALPEALRRHLAGEVAFPR